MGYTDTKNYKFKKPDESNNFDVMDLNNALDAVDKVLFDNNAATNQTLNGFDTRITTAQSTADSGVSAAGKAQSTANSAVSAASRAQSTANTAISRLDNIVIKTTWE